MAQPLADPTGWFLLEQDLYLPETWGVAAGPIDLDPLDLLRGARLRERARPVDIELSDSSGSARPDLVCSLYTLVSARLRAVLDASGVDNVQYFDARIVHPDGAPVPEPYFVANVIGRVRAVDRARSRVGPSSGSIRGRLRAFAIDPEAAADLRIFRLHESPILTVVDAALGARIAAAGLVGVDVLPTRDWTGIPGQSP